MVDEDITRAETTQSVLLWFGILGAPLAWTAQVIFAPDLAEILCYTGARQSGQGEVYGLPLRPVLTVFSAALALIAVAGIVVSFSCWRRTKGRDATPGQRARWMALSGIFVSTLFLLAMVINFFPLGMLGACERFSP